MDKLRAITIPLNEKALFDLCYNGFEEIYKFPKDKLKLG